MSNADRKPLIIVIIEFLYNKTFWALTPVTTTNVWGTCMRFHKTEKIRHEISMAGNKEK